MDRLPKHERITAFRILLNQFSNYMAYLLLATLSVSFILGDRFETVTIAVILFLNTLLGFFQEYKVDRSLASLETEPFDRQLKYLSNWLLAACFMTIIIVCTLGLLSGSSLAHLFFSSVSIAIAAIPEGLPAIISLVFAVSISRMDPYHALIKRLSTVQVLGSISILIIDKIDLSDPYILKALQRMKRAGIRLIVMSNGSQVSPSITIYKDLTPDDKLRIIEDLQKKGEIVANVEQGMNDASALKAADVGIAMGRAANTTKKAADIIINDNNFATIIHAIEESRGAYSTVLTCMRYLVSSNIAELMVILMSTISSFIGWTVEVALLPVQLLWLNIISDGAPALALAFDPPYPGLMEHPPRGASSSLITHRLAIRLLLSALCIAIGAYCAGLYGSLTSSATASTMTLTMLILLQFLRVYMVRPIKTFFSNPYLALSLALSLIMQFCILYIPQLQMFFKTVPLDFYQWVVMVMIMIAVWAVEMLITFILRRKKKRPGFLLSA